MCVQNLYIIVIEAAASGDYSSDTGISLDSYINTSGRQVLNPLSFDFFDTGAIIIGAASSSVPHIRIRASNYGRRITCYAWGENIVTTGGDSSSAELSSYTTNFGRTSGAAAFVVGAAVSAQGMARASVFSLTHSEMKNILSNPDVNTPSASPFTNRKCLMPD
ncbi:S8/S53 family peptidase [Telluribacter humicola]|uniref:hypothetical protein n=1 Tax=Telluribacter humicola TaxID=1720261 RepID=UPI001A96DFB4|nr:hypothetical protein [Telluribacter humicola]